MTEFAKEDGEVTLIPLDAWSALGWDVISGHEIDRLLDETLRRPAKLHEIELEIVKDLKENWRRRFGEKPCDGCVKLVVALHKKAHED